MANLMATMVKAMVKGKLNPGALTGLERFMLTQLTLPDRVPTMLAATNVEPYLIDEKFNYKMLAESVEANLELFTIVKQRFPFDVIMVPCWLGLMLTGASEYGVEFEIEEDRVPYAASHPINGMEDVNRMEILTEPSGYFKMTLDLHREAQRRFTDTIVTFSNDGPWDMAMLLRGDKQLPLDFRLYKDYTETKDPERREKIKEYGDPELWPAIMELTTQISTQIFKQARDFGIDMMGATMVDQFATEPVLSIDDFINYVLPYSNQARMAAGKGIGLGYMVSSPQKLEGLLTHPILGKTLGVMGFTNYIFPTTPEGITLPEYDQSIMELAKKNKRTYMYMVHAKFIRDASGEDLEAVAKRICGMAVKMRIGLMISVGAIAPGTDLKKIDVLLAAIHKYGRYSR